MKKGFFLLAALHALFSSNIYQENIQTKNKSLKNCNPISGGGGGNTKDMRQIMIKKRRKKKTLNRLGKQAKNINHKKAA